MITSRGKSYAIPNYQPHRVQKRGHSGQGKITEPFVKIGINQLRWFNVLVRNFVHQITWTGY